MLAVRSRSARCPPCDRSFAGFLPSHPLTKMAFSSAPNFESHHSLAPSLTHSLSSPSLSLLGLHFSLPVLLGWQTCASRLAASHCRAAARALPAARGSRSRQAGAPRAEHARTARREAIAECHGGASRQGDSSGTATRAAIRGAAPCILGEATSRLTRSFALVQFGRGLHPRLQMLTSEIEMRSRGHQNLV